MSYRELRDFGEAMRHLGFPKRIGIDSFRTPNFPIMAAALAWLVQRYDPHIDVPVVIDTQADRVHFVMSVVRSMNTRTTIQLNPRKLYAADVRAIRELNRIASVLYKAAHLAGASNVTCTAGRQVEELLERHEAQALGLETPETQTVSRFTEGGGEGGPADSVLSDQMEVQTATALMSQLGELQQARHVASEITTHGGKLYDLLEMEPELRRLRRACVDNQTDLEQVSDDLLDHVQSVRDEIQRLEAQAEEMEATGRKLQRKLDHEAKDLERQRKRLASHQNVVPAHQAEYEKLQGAMAQLYAQYLERYRNLEYLEQQLQDHHELETKVRDSISAEVARRLRESEGEFLSAHAVGRGGVARGRMDGGLDDDDSDIAEDVDSEGGNIDAFVENDLGAGGTGGYGGYGYSASGGGHFGGGRTDSGGSSGRKDEDSGSKGTWRDVFYSVVTRCAIHSEHVVLIYIRCLCFCFLCCDNV